MIRVWAAYKHLTGMENGLSISALMTSWISNYGLTEEDAIDILEKLDAPEWCGQFKFMSDLTTQLGGMVAARLAKRKAEHEAKELRTPYNPVTQAAAVELLKDLRSNFSMNGAKASE